MEKARVAFYALLIFAVAAALYLLGDPFATWGTELFSSATKGEVFMLVVLGALIAK